MSKLRAILNKRFSEKEYPDPKDPAVAAKIAEGRHLFEDNYLGHTFDWDLAGGDEVTDINCYETRFPGKRGVIVGRFHEMAISSTAYLNEYVAKVRQAGLRFFETTTVERRAKLLCTVSEVVKERFWLFVAAGMYETGQSLAEAIGETDEAVDFPLASAMYLEEMHENQLLRSPHWAGEFSGYRYLPHGVFLNIEPFNFPLAIPMDMAVKALAMGNAVIMKPSDKSSLCGYLVYESIIEAFRRLDIPHAGVVNYCPGGPDVVNMLLKSPDIAGVSFTGSSAALDAIKRTHGATLRNFYRGRAPLVYGSEETSGVNIAFVWKDADIRNAATECAKSFLGRSGQKCSSARVIMVHENIYYTFNRMLEEAVEKVQHGNVLDGADLGPVITREAGENIERTIDKLIKAGIIADIYTKKEKVSFVDDGLPHILYATPHIWLSDAKSRTLMNTEIFGPVTTVVSVPDIEVMRKLCEYSDFALTGTVFATDPEKVVKLAAMARAGNFYFQRKCTGALVESECFGGLASRSSPSGIKGRNALAKFGSQQTLSGFYPAIWDDKQKTSFVKSMENELGVVFSKT